MMNVISFRARRNAPMVAAGGLTVGSTDGYAGTKRDTNPRVREGGTEWP
jgi:hypothetical protein